MFFDADDEEKKFEYKSNLRNCKNECHIVKR